MANVENIVKNIVNPLRDLILRFKAFSGDNEFKAELEETRALLISGIQSMTLADFQSGLDKEIIGMENGLFAPMIKERGGQLDKIQLDTLYKQIDKLNKSGLQSCIESFSKADNKHPFKKEIRAYAEERFGNLPTHERVEAELERATATQ